jgi:hypothetical protein
MISKDKLMCLLWRGIRGFINNWVIFGAMASGYDWYSQVKPVSVLASIIGVGIAVALRILLHGCERSPRLKKVLRPEGQRSKRSWSLWRVCRYFGLAFLGNFLVLALCDGLGFEFVARYFLMLVAVSGTFFALVGGTALAKVMGAFSFSSSSDNGGGDHYWVDGHVTRRAGESYAHYRAREHAAGHWEQR